MTTRTNTDTTPRAWIGCLACYNNARLVGEWFDAETADKDAQQQRDQALNLGS